MKRFNYIQAWYQAANPAWTEVCEKDGRIPDLYRQVVTRPELQQASNLLVPSPSSEFDGMADGIDTRTLSLASQSVYQFGYWNPLGGNDSGSTRKLANILDQIIRRRLEITEDGRTGGDRLGITFTVIEGLIRVCVNTPNSWQWEELTYATEETLKEVRAIGRPLLPKRLGGKEERDYLNRAGEYLEKMVDKFRPPVDSDNPFSMLLNTSSLFYQEEKDSLYLLHIAADGNETGSSFGVDLGGDLETAVRLLADGKYPAVAGTVRQLVTRKDGKSWGVIDTIVHAEIIGESASMQEAIIRANQYRCNAEIRKGEERIQVEREKLRNLAKLSTINRGTDK